MNNSDEERYTINCAHHLYITLCWNGQFIECFDNDIQYMEEIIAKIERYTGMKFRDIPRIGRDEDFDGLRYRKGGFKDHKEILGQENDRAATQNAAERGKEWTL